MKQIHFLLLLFFLFIGMVSCTKNFTALNTNPNGVPFDTTTTGGDDAVNTALFIQYLSGQMEYVYSCNGASNVAAWYYQIQQNFNSDIYSGYWVQASPTGFGTGTNNESNFTLVSNWDDYLFLAWKSSLNSFATIKRSFDRVSNPSTENKAVLGMSYVVKVMMSVRTADAIGTLPYTSFGNANAAYDDLETIYNEFFKELDLAIGYFNEYLNDATVTTKIVTNADNNDYFYAGDVAKWVKFANSMKLRLGMRLAKVDNAKSKEIVQAAIASNNLITSIDDNAYFRFDKGEGALTTLTRLWGAGNTAIGATVQSILEGWSDPRLDIFISKTNVADQNVASSRIALGNYVSKRLGTAGITGSPDGAVYSFPGTGIPATGISLSTTPQSACFFNAAETQFLLAEAALRGWYSSDPKTLYESGVKLSMDQWGVSVGAYLSSSATPANYMDPEDAAIDIATKSTCKPSWDAATSNEEHLEQIITQKWLALWPVNSPEAWSEYRRTGYPKIFPPYVSPIAPTTTWGGVEVNTARKIKISANEYLNNGAAVSKALGFFTRSVIPDRTPGDNIHTTVWWDVDQPNF